MTQKDNVASWIDCWKASMGKREKKMEVGQADFWNKRSDEFAQHLTDTKGRKRAGEILGFLEETGFRAKGARVLDLGCGPGTLSIPLARAGADVTSLDIASGMLDHLKETAKKEDLPINALECSWWTADIDKLGFRSRFDLVLASMTPAVKDVETLDRMMACSKKYCYYSNFLQRGGDRAHRELLSTILKKGTDHHHGPGGGAMLYPFMYLYLKGYRPDVKISHRRWKEEQNWAEAAERTIEFLSHEHPCNAAAKKKILAYYEQAAKDGKYRMQSDVYTGMMVWTVNGRK